MPKISKNQNWEKNIKEIAQKWWDEREIYQEHKDHPQHFLTGTGVGVHEMCGKICMIINNIFL